MSIMCPGCTACQPAPHRAAEPALHAFARSPSYPMLPCLDRVVVLSWEDPMAQMGTKTLMGEGKWQGTVMGGLFFSSRALGTLPLCLLLSLHVGFCYAMLYCSL